MIDFSLVIPIDGCRGIEQGCQQVFPDVLDFSRVCLEASHDVTDVPVIQLQQPALYDLCREVAAGYKDLL